MGSGPSPSFTGNIGTTGVGTTGGRVQTTGAGTWILSGANTYTNGTTVGDGTNASTLTILGASSLPTSGSVVVNASSILNFDIPTPFTFNGQYHRSRQRFPNDRRWQSDLY